MVFPDDSPVERDEVRRAFPGLMIPELPEDTSRFVAAVEQTGFLEAIAAPTSEDENRAGF